MAQHEAPFVTAPPARRASAREPDAAGSRGLPWRRRALVAAALVGCLLLFGLARWMAAAPMIDPRWEARADGLLMLPDGPSAVPSAGSEAASPSRAVVAIGRQGGQAVAIDPALLQRSPRWQIDGGMRSAQIAQHEALATLLAQDANGTAEAVVLRLQDGSELQLPFSRRGYARLGLAFWPLAGLALLLYLSSMVVLLARPGLPRMLFALICWCQAGTLISIALQSMPGLGLPQGVYGAELLLRGLFDLCSAAAAVHGFTLYPRVLDSRRAVAGAAWGAAAVVLLCAAYAQRHGDPDAVWWVLQGGCVGLVVAMLVTVERSLRVERNPRTRVLRRFARAALATLLLVTLSALVASHAPGSDARTAAGIPAGAAVAWHLFVVSLLLLWPFLTRSQPLLREMALVAGVSTVAASLDLLLVTVFSLGSFASVALAGFLGLALYAGARRWVLERMLGARALSAERAFDHVYRTARALQSRPERYPLLLVQLLRDLYEPLDVTPAASLPRQSHVTQNGSALVVPQRPPEGGAAGPAVLLRFAQRGRRLFTSEDARLADRVLEHLRRAVAYDRAVERGRAEERLRIAQDLHDDIGARLLTLMYRAPTREMEDYLRHTLQDLKTLTRGLAAVEHRLSDAAGEWKADLMQRLSAAGAELDWRFGCDHDLLLSMAQWSALTRVLRELVSNALFHGGATAVRVDLDLRAGRLVLVVSDDGRGRSPASWAPGLGLGGVKKRVRGLGGIVGWQENVPRGIVCSVRVDGFGDVEQRLASPGSSSPAGSQTSPRQAP